MELTEWRELTVKPVGGTGSAPQQMPNSEPAGGPIGRRAGSGFMTNRLGAPGMRPAGGPGGGGGGRHNQRDGGR